MSLYEDAVAVAEGVYALETEVATLRAYIATLELQREQLATTLNSAEDRIVELEATIVQLQARIAELEAGTPPPPPPPPVPGAKWGPTGTAAPRSLLPGDALQYVVVDCTWAAIKTALLAVTPTQANEGIEVRVLPGTLPGYGAASGSTAVLTGVPRKSVLRNVVVTPANGWGSVKVIDSHKITKVYGVTFSRINAVYVRLTDSSYSVWSQSKVDKGGMITASGENVEQCDFHEVVMPYARTDAANDPFGYAAGTGVTVNHSRWIGMYIAPVFRIAGNSNHLDTIQMYGTGPYRGLSIENSVVWGSQNCALQIGGNGATDPNNGTPFLTVKNSYLASQRDAIDSGKWTIPANAYLPVGHQVINGNGEPGQLHFEDSVVVGTIYTNSTTRYGSIVRTSTSDTTPPPTTTGSWTVWADLFEKTPFPEVPTDAYLASIWS